MIPGHVEDDVVVFLERFAKAHLGTGDTVAGLCRLPCLAIRGGEATVLGTADEAAAWFAPRVERYRRLAVSDAQIQSLRTQSLGPHVVNVTTRWTVRTDAAEPVAEVGATYTLLRTPLGLRLAVYVAHDD